ncbi:FAM72 protein-domain-containing protein, partial [Entophlyctis helioformis]
MPARQASAGALHALNTGRAGHANANAGYSSASIHPSFRSKSVCQLECRFCGQGICKRGMKAILLADTRVELYSTDIVPPGRVQLVADDYMTRNCHCRIRDVACLGCGNVVGYHVTQPCEICMGACNNGHFWMFHSDTVEANDRMDQTG